MIVFVTTDGQTNDSIVSVADQTAKN